MSAEVKKEIQLDIAHVLFIDIVGYSKFSINEQGACRLLPRCSGSIRCSIRSEMIRVSKNSSPRPRRTTQSGRIRRFLPLYLGD